MGVQFPQSANFPNQPRPLGGNDFSCSGRGLSWSDFNQPAADTGTDLTDGPPTSDDLRPPQTTPNPVKLAIPLRSMRVASSQGKLLPSPARSLPLAFNLFFQTPLQLSLDIWRQIRGFDGMDSLGFGRRSCRHEGVFAIGGLDKSRRIVCGIDGKPASRLHRGRRSGQQSARLHHLGSIRRLGILRRCRGLGARLVSRRRGERFVPRTSRAGDCAGHDEQDEQIGQP